MIEGRKTQFSEHHTYVLPGWKVDEDAEFLCFLLATEHLLLNAYFSAESALPTVLCVDCTHKLVNVGHACIVFGTRSIDQKFHKIAYGIISDKTADTHKLCMKLLKSEIEDLYRRNCSAAPS